MIDIKDISGNIRFSTPINEGSKRKFLLMKEDCITLKFSLESPIYFKLGDYVDIPNDFTSLFEVCDIQKPTFNNSTGGYDYDLRLDAYYWKWKNKKFKYTPETGGQESSWSLTASLDVQLGVFLKNLQALGYTYRGKNFEFSIDNTVENKAIAMSYDNMNLLDALSAMAQSWECEYWITNSVINFGRCEYGTPVDFELGKNVETMTRSDSQTNFATRIYAFGSTRNIPTNYRPVDESVVVNGVTQKRLMLPVDIPYIDAYPNMSTEEAVEDIVVFDDVYPRRIGSVSDITTHEYKDVIQEEGKPDAVKKWNAYRFKDSGITFSKDYVLEGQELKIIFQSGALNGMEFAVTFNPCDKEGGEVPIPEKNADGSWNQAAQVWEIVRNEDYGRPLPDDVLRPQGEHMEGNVLVPADTYILSGFDTKFVSDAMIPAAEEELKEKALKYIEKSKIDPSTYDNKMMFDCMVDDNGNLKMFEVGDRVNLINSAYFETGSRQSRIIGFEYNLDIPYDSPVYTVGETASYSRIGEIENKIDSLTYKGQTYIGTGGSGVYVIGTNDSTLASNRNVFSALNSLKLFLSRQNDDEAYGLIKFLQGIISKGLIKADAGLEVSGGTTTDTLIASGNIAGENITASETVSGKNVSAAKKVSGETVVAIGSVKGNYVDATENVSGKNVLASEGVGGKTVTATDTVKGNHVQATETVSGKNVVASEKVTTLNLLVQALADTYDLNVSHVATLFRTTIKDYISSEQFISGFTGNGMKLYKALSGDWNLELDNLTVRKAMTVFELIISKIRAVNGGLVISPANGKVKSVLLTNGIYRLEIEDDMMFVADDLVRCQSFSVKSGVKYYWVRITSVSGSYIFINASEFTNSLPAVGDDLVQFGNKTNKLRQGLLYLTAAEDGKPRMSVLDGVNSTDLTGKTKVILGCLDDIVDSDFSADSQLSGYGLYAQNVFLKGMFILRSGKTVESEFNTTNAAVKEAQTVANAAKNAATAAQTTASTAVTNAATANTLLADLASDNKLTATEKQQAKKEWDAIVSEKAKNDASADKFSVSKTAYGTAYAALNTYITPLLSSLTTTSNITGTNFRAKFKAYYDSRTDLLNAISAKAKTLADAAQTKADSALTAASTAQAKANEASVAADSAQTAANNAQSSANSANALLTDIASDNKLTPTEKQSTKKEWDIIASEKPLNNAAAVKFGIATTAYDTAYNTLNTYITPLLVSLTTTSNITGTAFRAKFKAYYDARTNLLNAISAKAKALADAAQNELDNLQIGGRNLLLNSQVSKSGTSYNVGYWNSTRDFIIGEELTVTISGSITGTKLFGIWFNRSSINAASLRKVEEGLYSATFKVPAGTNIKQIGIYLTNNQTAGDSWSFEWIKLEAGNRRTDWTPAPEDIDNRITTVETNFEIREGQISAKVTEVTTKASQAATSATSASNSASTATTKANAAASSATAASGSATTAGQKATSAANSATAAATSATNAQKAAESAETVLEEVTTKESSITQTAGQIATKVTEVNKKVTEATTAATTATTKATAAATSATNAKTSETNAGTKATAAANSATAAAGSATNAKSSADSAAAKLTTITEKESSINQTASQISTKVTEVTKKATEAATSATNAATSATTAGTKATAAANSATAGATSATNAKSSADSAAAKLTTITQKESSINQTASSITTKVTEVNTKASQAATSATNAANSASTAGTKATNAANAAELATAMSQGKILYRDPSFKTGNNGISAYNNLGNGAVTVTRVSGIAGNPNGSGYCLKITTTAAASPSWGGFYWATSSKANRILIVRFIANVPTGRTLTFATNTIGTGHAGKWLTTNAGAGKWQEYAYKIVCGTSGTFSSTAFFYLTGGTTPTTSAPLVWYLCYATVYDVTDAEIDYIADAAGKYTTKTEHSSSITQLSDKIELKVSKTDFNALGNRVSNAETTITQHTNQIALKAAQSDVTALGNRMSSAEAKITPDAIKLTVKSQTDSIVAAAAKRTAVWVDATALDASKYYPITMVLGLAVGTYMISVSRELNTAYGKPSWSTHANGFSVLCRWTTNACGWGNREVKRTILDYTSSYANVVPVGNIGQLTNWSEEYIYVRGGSKYRVVVEGETGVSITLRTSGYTHTSSGYTQSAPVLTAVTAPIPDLNLRPTTETIKSQFTIDTGGISILGKKIALTGMVTFSSLASDAQGKINTAQSTANTANTTANTANSGLATLKGSLKSLAYLDTVEVAKLGTTVIEGGYLKTTLIKASSIDAGKIASNAITAVKIAAGVIDATKINVASIQAAVVTADKIAALNIKTKNLTVTNGATIGNFIVEGGGLYADNTVAIIGMSNSAYSTHMSAGQIVIDHPSAGDALNVKGGLCDVSFDVRCFTATNCELSNCKLSASNSNNPSLTLSNGFIAGMAVKARRISSSTTLDHSDCWVSCYNTGTITVYLPSNPQVGKMIFIMRINTAQIQVNGNGKSIHYGSSTVSVAPINHNGEIDIYVYDGLYWMNGWMNH